MTAHRTDRRHRIGRRPGLTALAAFIFLLPAATAARAQVGLGVKAGTQGAGVELTTDLTSRLSGRLGVNGFTYSDDREAGGIEYDADADLRTANALLDFHPGKGGFRLTGGLVYNATEVKGLSRVPASGTYPIGDVQVPAALLGRLRATIDFDPIVPYAGLGWGRPLAAGGRLAATLDLGVVFQGKGDVHLDPVFAPGSPIPNVPGAEALLRLQLDKEEREIEQDIEDYELYPVLAFGLRYRL